MSKMSFLPFKNVVLGYVIFDIPKIVPYLCSRNEGHEHMNNIFTQNRRTRQEQRPSFSSHCTPPIDSLTAWQPSQENPASLENHPLRGIRLAVSEKLRSNVYSLFPNPFPLGKMFFSPKGGVFLLSRLKFHRDWWCGCELLSVGLHTSKRTQIRHQRRSLNLSKRVFGVFV